MPNPPIQCPKCGHILNPGALLGARKSPRKSAASRANGKLGGRPRKTPPKK